GRGLDALHRALREVRPAVGAQLDERDLIDQQGEPLACRQLLALVLLRDLLLAATEGRRAAPLVQVVDERAQRRTNGGHRPFHTGSLFSKNAVTPSTMSSVDRATVS